MNMTEVDLYLKSAQAINYLGYTRFYQAGVFLKEYPQGLPTLEDVNLTTFMEKVKSLFLFELL